MTYKFTNDWLSNVEKILRLGHYLGVEAPTIPLAPSSIGRSPLPPISVATYPGSVALTKMLVP